VLGPCGSGELLEESRHFVVSVLSGTEMDDQGVRNLVPSGSVRRSYERAIASTFGHLESVWVESQVREWEGTSSVLDDLCGGRSAGSCYFDASHTRTVSLLQDTPAWMPKTPKTSSELCQSLACVDRHWEGVAG